MIPLSSSVSNWILFVDNTGINRRKHSKQNRKHAKKSRLCKKSLTSNLEQSLEILWEENAKLQACMEHTQPRVRQQEANNEFETVQGRRLLLLLLIHSWKASWDSFFAHSTGRLSLSLRLTQAKPLGSHDSNSRHRR